MAKHRLHESRDFLWVLVSRQVFDPGTYIHDLGSNEGRRVAHRGRGEATGQHHHSSGETRPSLLCDAEIERHTGTTERMGNHGLDEYRIGIESRVAEAVEIGGCGDPHYTPYQESPAAEVPRRRLRHMARGAGHRGARLFADSQNFFDALITEDTENGDGSAGGYDPGGRCPSACTRSRSFGRRSCARSSTPCSATSSVDAAKTGMLFSRVLIETVADYLDGTPGAARRRSGDGRELRRHVCFDSDAVGALVGRLFPLATVVTPNLPGGEGA